MYYKKSETKNDDIDTYLSFMRWNSSKANKYIRKMWIQHGPLVGFNFITSTCVNQLEFWQKDTWDPERIKFELGYGQKIGFNLVRVFLHHVPFIYDSSGFVKRIHEFLDICEKFDFLVVFVFFDDCWNFSSKAGKQPEPQPGVHNSRWKQSPGTFKDHSVLETYTKTIIKEFQSDSRIFCWDLYNEPGNSLWTISSLSLLKKSFKWLREVNPIQPCTACVWYFPHTNFIGFQLYKKLNEFVLRYSDIISFHSYQKKEKMIKSEIKYIKSNKFCKDYPLVVTEYMSRISGNTFQNVLPYYIIENTIPCIHWGLFKGKTQTYIPWTGNKLFPHTGEIKLWHHDVLHEDGKPYDSKEVKFITDCISKSKEIIETFKKVEISPKKDDENEKRKPPKDNTTEHKKDGYTYVFLDNYF